MYFDTAGADQTGIATQEEVINALAAKNKALAGAKTEPAGADGKLVEMTEQRNELREKYKALKVDVATANGTGKEKYRKKNVDRGWIGMK